MSFVTDGLGEWFNLGVVTPQPFMWIRVPNLTIDYESLFRLNFLNYNPNGYNGFAWLRVIYITPIKISKPITERSIKIYPKQESTLINFNYHEELTDKKIFVKRQFEVQKILKLPKYTGTVNSNNWSLNIEEYIK